ncbi:MAG: hypothetical protein HY903_11940 [Deltaproteobacteria bacterium]|nr:hypothetical protein [Deltaproteobacteria bacterium]
MRRAALRTGLAALASLVWAPAALAQDLTAPPTDDERAREAELFGAPSAPTPDQGAAPEGDSDQKPVVEAPVAPVAPVAPAAQPTPPASNTEERMAAALVSHDATTALGGLLYLRLDYNALEHGKPKTFLVSSPSLFDVYLDARPSEHVRGYVRGRLKHDATVTSGSTDAFGNVRQGSTVLLDQLWLKFDVGDRVWVTAGRQAIRWGSGRFWNPTDFMNQQVRDPLAVFDEREGVTLVKVHLPIEALGWNFYALGNFERADRPDEVGGGLRAELLFESINTELALSAAKTSHGPTQLGAEVSAGVGLVDLRAEAGLQKGVRSPFYRGELDPARLVIPEPYSRDGDWLLQATAGAELALKYSDEDNVTVGAEAFYNGAGYADAELYPWLFANQRYTPLYAGRRYAALYALLMAPGSWNDTTFILSGIGNLSDRSYLARLDYRVRVLTYLDVNLYGAYHFGQVGELHYSYALEPLPVDGLRNGIVIVAPRFDVGVGLRAAF